MQAVRWKFYQAASIWYLIQLVIVTRAPPLMEVMRENPQYLEATYSRFGILLNVVLLFMVGCLSDMGTVVASLLYDSRRAL